VIDAPCAPRFRADPSYISVSEASGGQMLLLDRSELGSPIVTRAQMAFRDPTILRVSGTLAGGFQEFTAPVDSTLRTLQFTIFAECVRFITVTAPSGAAMDGTKFASGRIVFVDSPETGVWRVKLAGTGYFSAVAQGKSSIALNLSGMTEPNFTARLTGPVEGPTFRALSRNGSALGTITVTKSADGYQAPFPTPAEPFRIAVEGIDSQGLPFRRIHDPLIGQIPRPTARPVVSGAPVVNGQASGSKQP
jgi:hypothetical protein